MTTGEELQPLPPWLAWPIRILAVIFVVPVKLAWDACTVVLRFLWRHVGVPLYTHVLLPVFYYVLWVPLRWVVRNVLWAPLAWLAEHVLVPLLTALWHGLVAFAGWLDPFWRLLGRVLLEVAKGAGWALSLVYRYLLRPLGVALAWAWRWSVVPLALAVAWAWNHSVALLWRYLVVVPVSWTWRTVVVPAAGWVRTAVLHPVGGTIRRVLAALRLR